MDFEKKTRILIEKHENGYSASISGVAKGHSKTSFKEALGDLVFKESSLLNLELDARDIREKFCLHCGVEREV